MGITEYNETETYELLKAECEARGREEERPRERIRTLVELIRSGLLSEDNAAKNANMSLSDFKKAAALYCS